MEQFFFSLRSIYTLRRVFCDASIGTPFLVYTFIPVAKRAERLCLSKTIHQEHKQHKRIAPRRHRCCWRCHSCPSEWCHWRDSRFLKLKFCILRGRHLEPTLIVTSARLRRTE